MTKRQRDEIDRTNRAVMAALMMREDAEQKHSETLMILAREQESTANKLMGV